MDLTEKQSALLKFIEKYQIKYGSSPTLREMRDHFGVRSDNSVLKPLKVLEEKGYIKKDDTPRGIKLLEGVKRRFEAIEDVVSLPLLGRIPAGNPTASEEYIEGRVTVDANLVKDANSSFLLTVKGESMIDAGIFDGDWVIVSNAKEPRVNDIVIALIDGENTLKRLVKDKGAYFLMAENKNFPEIYPRHELEIQGVVTVLLRRY